MFVIDVSESLSDPVRSPNIDICNVFLSYRLFNTSIGLRGQLNSYKKHYKKIIKIKRIEFNFNALYKNLLLN